MGILLCEQNFRDVWRRNKSVGQKFVKFCAHTHKHTHAAKLVVRKYVYYKPVTVTHIYYACTMHHLLCHFIVVEINSIQFKEQQQCIIPFRVVRGKPNQVMVYLISSKVRCEFSTRKLANKGPQRSVLTDNDANRTKVNIKRTTNSPIFRPGWFALYERFSKANRRCLQTEPGGWSDADGVRGHILIRICHNRISNLRIHSKNQLHTIRRYDQRYL